MEAPKIRTQQQQVNSNLNLWASKPMPPNLEIFFVGGGVSLKRKEARLAGPQSKGCIKELVDLGFAG